MGKLLIFSAPSGSGKTTIVKEVLKHVHNLEFSISACSRPPRHGEIDGKDYYFLSVDAFKERIRYNEFVEYEEVYPNQFYGTLKNELIRIWENGNHVVFDVDVIGGLNIKKQYPEQSLSIFIQAPSIYELKKRLENRGTETAESLTKRIQKAEYELSFANEFDTIILNSDLELAVKETIKQVKDFLGM